MSLNLNVSLRIQDELNALIDRHIERRVVKDTCWRVKWRGKFIILNSGKSSWRTQGYAKSAFSNHLASDYYMAWEYIKIKHDNPKIPYGYHNIKEYKDDILNSGDVEYVEVRP